MIVRNGKYIAPFHRFVVTDFSTRRVTGTRPHLQGQVSQSHKPWFSEDSSLGRRGVGGEVSGRVHQGGTRRHGMGALCATPWVTAGSGLWGHSAFLPALWFPKGGGVGGMYLLRLKGKGARQTSFISGPNKNEKQNKTEKKKKKLNLIIRLGCQVP